MIEKLILNIFQLFMKQVLHRGMKPIVAIKSVASQVRVLEIFVFVLYHQIYIYIYIVNLTYIYSLVSLDYSFYSTFFWKTQSSSFIKQKVRSKNVV